MSIGTFEGHDVVGTAIKVTKAGDGLSPALKVEPVEYELGEEIHVVLKTRVANVQFVPSKDDANNLIRLHTIETSEATVVEGTKVKGLLAAQRKKIEEAEGISKLPGLDETDPAADPAAGDDPKGDDD